MSYTATMVAIKTALDTSSHLDGYQCKVLARVDGRQSLSINSAFGVEICIPDGIYTTNLNECVTDDDETSDPSFADMETHTFKIRCRELRQGKTDFYELFDSSDKTVLTLTDKVRNALADTFFTGTYVGFEYGPISMINLPDTQGEWVTEFDFRVTEQIDGRNR